MDRMAKEKEFFDNIFDEMKELRIQQAQNAGFDNYRDYMHQAKGRFAYTPQDLIEFHNAVEKEVLPFLKELSLERKEKLKVDKLRPWDTSVDLDGRTLKPYETIDEFIDKAIDILYEIKPIFGIRLNMMKNSGFLDLENRKGKSPGGYNYPLQETGAPFIFMNAVKLHRDIVTLLHECTHLKQRILKLMLTKIHQAKLPNSHPWEWNFYLCLIGTNIIQIPKITKKLKETNLREH